MDATKSILCRDVFNDRDAPRIRANNNVIYIELVLAQSRKFVQLVKSNSTMPQERTSPPVCSRTAVGASRIIKLSLYKARETEGSLPLLLPASLNAARVRMMPKTSWE